MQFSEDDSHLFITAGDEALIKVFVLPVAVTPEDAEKIVPHPLTSDHAASSVQILPNGRLIFTQSSLTSPNDVFIVRGLKGLDTSNLTYQQVTKFTADGLKGKDLDAGESFWFEGAEGKKVQGWTLKPKGWKEGATKAFPVVLLIHGGPQGAWEDQWSTRWNPNGKQFHTTVKRVLNCFMDGRPA